LALPDGARLHSLVEMNLPDQRLIKAEFAMDGDPAAVLEQIVALHEVMGWRRMADLVEAGRPVGAVLDKSGDVLNVRLQTRDASVNIVAVITRAAER
jgi:hypothetical protein